MDFVFRPTGLYLGFIVNGVLFSRDGVYLGWAESSFVWDAAGRFRGQLLNTHVQNNKYLVYNKFGVQPVPKPPRDAPIPPALPPPPQNIASISLPTGWGDAF